MSIDLSTSFLTAAEAAAALGVKRATLYTYVSRGLLRVAPGPDRRSRRYLAADVEALRLRAAAARGSAPAAATALDWGVPVLASEITSIDIDGPNYRGVPALALAEDGFSYEAVVELLWTNELPEETPRFAADGLGLDPDALERLVPERAPPHGVLAAAVPLLGLADPLRQALTERAELARARTLILRLAAALALSGPRATWRDRADAALRASTVSDAVLLALGGPPTGRERIDRALVVCADHELNASSFAARVAAGTGADLYACVSAALAALSGPRHGAQSDRVEAVLDEALGAPDLPRWLGERFGRGEPPPGFGHRLYPDGDPRAEVLLADATGESPRLRALRALVTAMAEAGHPPPNLDVGLVATCASVGLPSGSAAAVFAVGRCAGWVAHAREQRASGRMLRPRARYVGP